MNASWWQRAAALENRHNIAPGASRPHQTIEEAIHEQVARQCENEREMAALAIANKKLVARGLILVRGNVFDDASLGRFYLKRVSDGEIVARDVSPGRVAESLAGKNCDAFYG